MTEEQKVLYMFELLHGKMTGACSAQLMYDEENDNEIYGVACVKDGEVVWCTTLVYLVFAYATRDLD